MSDVIRSMGRKQGLYHEVFFYSVPDEHIPEDGEVAVVTVFNCNEK